MNFKIVEGCVDEFNKELYEQFISLYNNTNIPVQDIRVKLGLNSKKYTKYRQKALHENRIKPRRIYPTSRKKQNKKNNVKNYSYNPHIRKWYVKKGKDYKTITYGAYDSEEIAKKIVEKLKEHDWDINYLTEIQEEVLGNNG